MPMHEGFALRAVNARTQRELTQLAVANHLGLSRAAVAMWETGRSEPGLSRIVALAALFDVTPEYLAFKIDPENKFQALETALTRDFPDGLPPFEIDGRSASINEIKD